MTTIADNIHERIVRQAITRLADKLMADKKLIRLIKDKLDQGLSPEDVQELAAIEIDSRLNPGKRVLPQVLSFQKKTGT